MWSQLSSQNIIQVAFHQLWEVFLPSWLLRPWEGPCVLFLCCVMQVCWSWDPSSQSGSTGSSSMGSLGFATSITCLDFLQKSVASGLFGGNTPVWVQPWPSLERTAPLYGSHPGGRVLCSRVGSRRSTQMPSWCPCCAITCLALLLSGHLVFINMCPSFPMLGI